MARPPKKREVCCLPEVESFFPKKEFMEEVVMTVDEYETIRLIDYEEMTQEECASQMKVSRATIQGVYNDARKKVADILVNGKLLKIEGGDYQLCTNLEIQCDECTRRCPKNRCRRHSVKKNKSKEESRGNCDMRIAVTYEAGMIFGHFGHTSQFKIYDVEAGEIKSSEVVDTNGSGHGALAGFLADRGIDVLICGGIGMGAQNALRDAGIKLYGGASGDADENVKAFIAGNLSYNPEVKCNHHDHEHGEGHVCGNHGCGNH